MLHGNNNDLNYSLWQMRCSLINACTHTLAQLRRLAKGTRNWLLLTEVLRWGQKHEIFERSDQLRVLYMFNTKSIRYWIINQIVCVIHLETLLRNASDNRKNKENSICSVIIRDLLYLRAEPSLILRGEFNFNFENNFRCQIFIW